MKMAKVREFFGKAKKKLVAVGVGGMLAAMTAVNCFAAEEGVTSGDTTFVAGATELFNKATGSINIANIVAILGIGIGAALVLMLFWWGSRKLIRMLLSAFRKGKISV